MARKDEQRSRLLEYGEATPEAARQMDEYPWFPALLGLIAAAVIGVALLVWLS